MLAWTSVVVALPIVWVFLIVWYCVVFGIFGVFTIPFRFFRRGQRKSLTVQQEQFRLMQRQMEQQQERAAPFPAPAGTPVLGRGRGGLEPERERG